MHTARASPNTLIGITPSAVTVYPGESVTIKYSIFGVGHIPTDGRFGFSNQTDCGVIYNPVRVWR